MDDPAAVVSRYDEWAPSYDDDLAEWGYEAPEVVARSVAAWWSASGAVADGAVLDAGCGTGLVGRALREVGITAIDGPDVSARSLAVAAERHVYRRLVAHDLTRVPYPVAAVAYDAAVCVGVLSYVPRIDALLRELCRAVRPDGIVVISYRDDLWGVRARYVRNAQFSGMTPGADHQADANAQVGAAGTLPCPGLPRPPATRLGQQVRNP